MILYLLIDMISAYYKTNNIKKSIHFFWEPNKMGECCKKFETSVFLGHSEKSKLYQHCCRPKQNW